MGKAGKGTVSVQSLKGRLRLAWRVEGKRYFLSLGLPDDPIGRSVAEVKARTIERDIRLDNFDFTLERYRSSALQPTGGLTVVGLFDRFSQWKADKVDDRTMEKYRAVQVRVAEYFIQQTVASLKEKDCEKFKQWLLGRQAPVTVQSRLGLLRACWTWGMKQGLVSENPWAEVSVKVPPQQRPKPFTLEEIQTILQAFRESRPYRHYVDFVEFLFGTGCRTGEAIGLRWQHLNEDCSRVWIGEIVTRGKRKAAKTNRARTVPLSRPLQQMLLRRRGELETVAADGLVFPAPKGGAIDDHNFRNRAWVKILEQCQIEYRRPYLTRSTLASHALAQGLTPVEVSELTGHSVQVLYRHYAGNVNVHTQLPEITRTIE